MGYLSSVVAQSDGSTVAVTGSFTMPAAATYCAILVLMRGGDGGATTLVSGIGNTEIGGVPFDLDSGNFRRFDGFQAIDGGYILADDLPSGSVTCTATRSSAVNGMILVVSFFDGVVQNAPIISLNGYPSSPPDPVLTSITTTTDAIIVDMIGTSNNSAVFTVQETGQVEREADLVIGASTNMSSSTRPITGSGSFDMSHDTGGNGARTTHVLYALELESSGTAGDVVATTEDSTIAATGTTGSITGDITVTTEDSTISATGTVGPYESDVVATTDDSTIAATGTIGPYESDVIATTEDSTIAATGTTGSITGDITVTTEDSTIAATGTIGPYESDVIATTEDSTIAATGTTGSITGDITVTTEDSTIAATGTIGPYESDVVATTEDSIIVAAGIIGPYKSDVIATTEDSTMVATGSSGLAISGPEDINLTGLLSSEDINLTGLLSSEDINLTGSLS